jgi:DNA primase
LPDDRVTLVKQANDIVDVIGEYLPLRKQGRTFKGLCPFHDDHTPSMTVDPQHQNFKCWACGKYGDVITFVQERERVEFLEALQILARRANIELKRGDNQQSQRRMQLLDLMKWAEEQFHRCLLESAIGERAKDYLSERKLSLETIKKFRLGYAPAQWDWLVSKARTRGWSNEMLVTVGLCAARENDGTLYDRFRDRVIFPIRDVRGRTVGFGGRLLPGPDAPADAPKYYNSSDTPLFSKSENLYGVDEARKAPEADRFLAVVEGYTDVLMAHQAGVLPVVATLGTALNVRHIAQLKRYTPSVVLLFDADAGGERGVDRALELFVSQDVELKVATLPTPGLDPCDFLIQRGPDAFRAVLAQAVDALDFKLQRAFTPERLANVEGKRRAVDDVLRILALAPESVGPVGLLKRQLMVNRIGQQAGLKEEIVWERLKELRKIQKGVGEREAASGNEEQPKAAPAARHERELLAVLLAEPTLIEKLPGQLEPNELRHPGLRRVLVEMQALRAEGDWPEIDRVRLKLADNARLAEYVMVLQAEGLATPLRAELLEECLRAFQRLRDVPVVTEIQNQLRSVANDGPPPVELLKRLQERR